MNRSSELLIAILVLVFLSLYHRYHALKTEPDPSLSKFEYEHKILLNRNHKIENKNTQILINLHFDKPNKILNLLEHLPNA
jgi:hypothetical protein